MKFRQLAAAAAIAFATAPAANAAVYFYSGVPLIGTEETPPVFGGSFGALTATYDDVTNALVYMFQWKFPDGENATDAHFHGPAARGESAAPVIPLGPVSGASGKSSGVVTLTEGEEAELLAGLWYINVHSASNPGGEIRGQVLELSPLDTATVFDLNHSNLYLESVIVPRLGVFDAVMDWLDPSTLRFAVTGAVVKDLDDPDSEDDFSDDDSADSADDSGDDSADSADDSGGDSADDSADSADDSASNS